MKKTMYLLPIGLLGFSFLIEFTQDSISFFSPMIAQIVFFVSIAILSYLILLELVQASIHFYRSIHPQQAKAKEETNHDNKRNKERKESNNTKKPATNAA